MENILMKVFLLLAVLQISQVAATDYRNLVCYDNNREDRENICPEINCNDDDYATDTDDVCVSFELHKPYYLANVTIRECKGETKKYCMWGKPSFNKEFAWPFSQVQVLNKTITNHIDDNFHVEARCVDEDYYFQRGSLYPNFPCINDLECRSKKCSYGFCLGVSEGGLCYSNADCMEYLACKVDPYYKYYTCQTLSAFNETCANDYECQVGLFCNKNSTCTTLFSLARREDPQSEPLQCESGGYGKDKLCFDAVKGIVGGFYNPDTNNYDAYEDPKANNEFACKAPNFCVSDHRKTRNFGCVYTSKEDSTLTDFFMTVDSPFIDYGLFAQQSTDNCMCGQLRQTYCLRKGTEMFKNMHIYYRDQIVPNIQACHTDFRYDVQMWLHCKYSEVSTTQVEQFSDYMEAMVESVYQDQNQTCIQKVSPYFQKHYVNATLQTLYIETKEVSTTVILTNSITLEWSLLIALAALTFLLQ